MSRRILIRIIIVLAGLWIVLLGLIYITKGKYRDHTIAILKTQLNEYIATEIHIRKDDIHVSLIRKFPYAVIYLKDIFIKSSPNYTQYKSDAASQDTLLFANNISLMFNLGSLFKKVYVLKKIEIQDAKLTLLRNAEGITNFHIIKQAGTENLRDTVTFNLKDIEIRNLLLHFHDSKAHVKISGRIQKGHLTGSFTGSDFYSNTQINSKNTSLIIREKKILVDDNLLLSTSIQKKESEYVFSEGNLTLYGIPMRARGVYNTLNENYNFIFTCTSVPFQKLDNSFINRYLGDLKLKPSGGSLNINVDISGKDSSSPRVKLSYLLHNGMIRHRDTRIKAENIYTKGYYTNGSQNNKSSSRFQIDSLFLKSGDSELYLVGEIQNFNSPSITGNIRGDLELDKLSIIKAIEKRVDMKGRITANIKIKGNLPRIKDLKHNDIKKVNLQGFILLKEASFTTKNKSLPGIVISGRITLKNLSEINLDNIEVITEATDLKINGNVTNLPFFTSDRSLFPVYKCHIISNEFHLEDFLISADNSGKDSIHIALPDSMILYADAIINSFSFGKFNATGVSGNLFYRPKTLEINDFSMQTQGGTIKGNVDFTQVGSNLISTANIDLQRVDIGDMFYAFNEFGQSVITHESIDGNFTGKANIEASWDLHLNPLYDKLKIQSDVFIEKGELIDYQPLLGLSDFIEVEELKHIKFDDLHATVRVVDRKVTIDQTQINSSALSLVASGEHDFDNRYTYRVQVHLADILWKKAKKKKPENSEFGYIIDDDNERTILPLIITGKDTIFRVNYDKKTAGSIFREKLNREKEELKELVTPDSSDKKDDQHFRIEWEEELNDTDNQKQNEQNEEVEEFRIEWDDK